MVHALLPREMKQNGGQFDFISNIQKGGRLVEHQNARLLAERTGNHHPLTLTVADAANGLSASSLTRTNARLCAITSLSSAVSIPKRPV